MCGDSAGSGRSPATTRSISRTWRRCLRGIRRSLNPGAMRSRAPNRRGGHPLTLPESLRRNRNAAAPHPKRAPTRIGSPIPRALPSSQVSRQGPSAARSSPCSRPSPPFSWLGACRANNAPTSSRCSGSMPRITTGKRSRAAPCSISSSSRGPSRWRRSTGPAIGRLPPLRSMSAFRRA